MDHQEVLAIYLAKFSSHCPVASAYFSCSFGKVNFIGKGVALPSKVQKLGSEVIVQQNSITNSKPRHSLYKTIIYRSHATCSSWQRKFTSRILLVFCLAKKNISLSWKKLFELCKNSLWTLQLMIIFGCIACTWTFLFLLPVIIE